MSADALDVTPVLLDLRLYAGDDFTMRIDFIHADTKLPYPLTGTWLAQVRAEPEATSLLTSFAIDVSQMAQGKLYLSLSGEQVRGLLSVFPRHWDLQQIPQGQTAPRTWYRGTIRATGDVTR